MRMLGSMLIRIREQMWKVHERTYPESRMINS